MAANAENPMGLPEKGILESIFGKQLGELKANIEKFKNKPFDTLLEWLGLKKGITNDTTAKVKEVHSETETGLRNTVINKALAHLGKRETSQNAGPEIQIFTRGKNEPWCADFVSYVLNEAGIPIQSGEQGWKVPSVEAIRQHYKKLGQWTDVKLSGSSSIPDCVKPGDLITWTKDNASGEGTRGHIGIVEKVEYGKVYTIEGNTRGEGSTRPDMVARKEHKVSELINDTGTVGVCTLA